MNLQKNLDLERCPHCSVHRPNLNMVGGEFATNNFEGSYPRVWKTYVCTKCGGAVLAFSTSNNIAVVDYFPSTQGETFEFEYLDGDVEEDFKEALKCYSHQCFNAFASMCRRTIQSAANKLGSKGKDRVKKQITELKEIAGIEDDTYQVLEQIIIAGHDGAHPNLPKLSPERAAILLILMKDVLNELFVRKARVKKVMELRLKEIEKNKSQKT